MDGPFERANLEVAPDRWRHRETTRPGIGCCSRPQVLDSITGESRGRSEVVVVGRGSLRFVMRLRRTRRQSRSSGATPSPPRPRPRSSVAACFSTGPQYAARYSMRTLAVAVHRNLSDQGPGSGTRRESPTLKEGSLHHGSWQPRPEDNLAQTAGPKACATKGGSGSSLVGQRLSSR